ncbi:MAG: hypothetical protein COB83_08080 [Gammaproteobacteria bacterium]|nr:MAG: hypothetical protein COB83_08080 [Gammaproteobacteria bacterium]
MTEQAEQNKNTEDKSAENETEQTPEQQAASGQQAERDSVAAQMAKEMDEDENQEFDPSNIPEMTTEQEQVALEATQDMLETPEGAEFAAVGVIAYYEELLQEHGHEKFTITDKKKEIGARRLQPVIQKYAPQALGLLGQYKSEVMAALWVGSLAYSSVKQLKTLKALDNAEQAVSEAPTSENEAA